MGCIRRRIVGENPQVEALAAAGERAADAAEPDDADRGTPQAGRAVRLAAPGVSRVTTRHVSATATASCYFHAAMTNPRRPNSI
jgi:hypothetical protein